MMELIGELYPKYKARKMLNQLKSHEQEKIRAIGEALHESLIANKSVEEGKWIEAIEGRRNELRYSNEVIEVVDFGAGSYNSTRTQEEMKRGVLFNAKVSKIINASKSPFWAHLLFKLTRKLKPAMCVELGSSLGISTCYIGAALNLNGHGKLVSMEGAPEIARIAKESLQQLHINNASVVVGPFYETLEGVFASSKPIDFFFNDGHHSHDAVIDNFNKALPFLSKEAVVVFDDISWSEGMKKAWSTIVSNEKVRVSIDLFSVGIVLLGDNSIPKSKF
ncbi:MAG: class I SAM-dependent methyltransferase [Sphingobacteriaceae bacterium]|nr:class I SAM-dependent methyltransferase [Sphingobacteriaceae bacterium]